MPRKHAVILGNREDRYFYLPIEKSFKVMGWDYTIIPIDDNGKYLKRILELIPDFVLLTPSDFSKRSILYAEFGVIQGFLECLKIKYSGSGVLSNSIGVNKSLSKLFFKALNLNTPKYIFISINDEIPDYDIVRKELGDNLIIKPNQLGDSIGVSLLKNDSDYYLKTRELRQQHGDFLIEEFIDGGHIEYTTGIFEHNNGCIKLPICKTITQTDFFSHQSKMNDLNTKEILNESQNVFLNKMKDISLIIHRTLSCKNFSRTDFVIDKNNNIYVLEVNLLPGLLPNSIFPQLCKSIGIEYEDIIFSLVN